MVQIGNGSYIAYARGHRIKWGVSAWLVNRHDIWCLIRWAQLNGTMSNKVAWLIEMVKKICVGYQQVGIDPPLE